MRSRKTSHLRTKIIALLAALAALWAFAAWVTVRDGLNLLFVSTLANEAGIPTEQLVEALQQERRLSAVVLGGAAGQRPELADSRVRTDRVIASWRDHVDGRALAVAAGDRLEAQLDQVAGQVDGLPALRAQVDGGELDRRGAIAGYTGIVDAGLAVYASLSSLDDQEVTRQSQLLTDLTRARELLAQQDALVAGALAGGGFAPADLTALTQLVGAQRYLYDQVSAELPAEDLALYREAAGSEPVAELRRIEDLLVDEARPGADPPVTAQEWDAVAGPAIAELRELELAAVDNLLQRATPVVVGVVVRLLLAGGLGLVAVIAAVVISITTARSLVRQLERLRDAARELARHRLPRVVDRLSAGETVDVAAEAPPLRFGDDEIGQVGQAFNAVQETAVRAAVQQAELRRGVRDVFLSLARRTQGLVHKQLSVVDEMERRQTDADEMADLYRIDHLATRMRRNAENLIVLAGAAPGRGGRRSVPMIDVIRGAMAEVEEYQRVSVQPVQDAELAGRVVGDVVHLLAELIENATSFSPPYAKVSVGGQRVAHGFAVEIEDRGLGMSEAELATVNQQLADPPDFSLADASRLGHYVVAKLAQRHGIRVHLRTSPYGGITAIVLVPQPILAEPGEPEPDVPDVPDVPDLAEVPDGLARREVAAPVAVVRQRQDGGADPAAGADPAVGTGDAVPGTAEPARGTAEPARGTAAARTPSGLPWRVRQASLPRQLWSDHHAGEPAARDPEVVRRAMSSYQLGTQRGRSAAAGPPNGGSSGAHAAADGAPERAAEQAAEPAPEQRDDRQDRQGG